MAQRHGKGYTGARLGIAESTASANASYRTVWNYADIDFIFKPTLAKDLSVKYDGDSIKQSVKNILLTNKFERPWNPNFGVNLRNLLFENPDTPSFFFLKDEAETEIRRQIAAHEPRVELQVVNFKLSESGDTLSVSVDYKLKPVRQESISQTVIVKIQAERIR